MQGQGRGHTRVVASLRRERKRIHAELRPGNAVTDPSIRDDEKVRRWFHDQSGEPERGKKHDGPGIAGQIRPLTRCAGPHNFAGRCSVEPTRGREEKQGEQGQLDRQVSPAGSCKPGRRREERPGARADLTSGCTGVPLLSRVPVAVDGVDPGAAADKEGAIIGLRVSGPSDRP